MTQIYDIPSDTKELFANGEQSYRIIDYDRGLDNIEAMRLFIESVGIPEEQIEIDDGTQIVINNGEKKLVIDSGGLGDFFSHGFDVTEKIL